ncbi:Ig-like domain-containing protein [Compostimonas suwonensis]|uniref:Glycine rich protein n=1 Tax=Compostimonas suwonensis TaxID=1048394 RepID=A0A2M9C3J1_9MICO|nr:hypothetical protein [Compostimonas suwonensis]PJJ65104.1 glycine rich protein [Compostimonas suwonensis]
MKNRTLTLFGLAVGALIVTQISLPAHAQTDGRADGGPVTIGQTATKVFTFTGAPETWVVPAGISTVTVSALGAGGGSNGDGSTAGSYGAQLTGVLNVTPGQNLIISVGGVGGTAPENRLGGWGGMGAGGGDTPDNHQGVQGGGGGGASTIETSLGTAAFVAGGGGGDGGYGANEGGAGGAAGTGVGVTEQGMTAVGSRGGNGAGPGSGGGGEASTAPTSAGANGSHESWGGGDGGGGGGGVRGGSGGAAGGFGSGGGGGGGAGGSFIAPGVQSPSIAVGSNLAQNGSITLSWVTYLNCTANTMQADIIEDQTSTVQLPCSSSFPLTAITVLTAPVHASIFNVDLSTGSVDVAPVYGYTGPDSFTIEIQDASGGAEHVTVTLNVTEQTTSESPQVGGDRLGEASAGADRASSTPVGTQSRMLAATGSSSSPAWVLIAALCLGVGSLMIAACNRSRSRRP